jgi:hypothetical protein
LLSVISIAATLLRRVLLVDQADLLARPQSLLRLLVAVVARDQRVLDQVHKAAVVGRRVRSDTT